MIWGFNIAILAGLLLAVSRPILGHTRSAWFVIFGIITYIIFVGADAAVVRAAIMAALYSLLVGALVIPPGLGSHVHWEPTWLPFPEKTDL